MPVISHRGAQMPPSPIRKLVPYADAAKKGALKFITSTSASLIL